MGRTEGQLFIGRIDRKVRAKELEDVFRNYGRVNRCEIKYGAEMAYAFVDFEDRRDAEDAIKYENGRYLEGSSIIVEWAKGRPRPPAERCYNCGRAGHYSRDCTDGGGYGGYRRPRGGRFNDTRRRRRSYSRSRSRSRSRDRSSRRRRTRSRSKSGSKSPRRSRNDSKKDKSKSRSRSRSGSPVKSKSKSRSPSRSKSRSKSKSRSPSRSKSRSRSRSGSK